jgi:uncharacterized membrane protein
MKTQFAASLVLLIFLLASDDIIYGGNQVEYNTQIDNEGSAVWTIIQVLESNFSYSMVETFYGNLTKLVENVENKTGREMSAWIEEINIIPQDNYSLVKYILRWKNFSKIENSKIIVGDIFQVENFFSEFYGDGVVYLTYPLEYVVETVSPKPDEKDDTHQTLKWFSAERFSTQTPNIIFARKTSTPEFLEFLQQNTNLIVSLVIMVSVSSILFYLLKRQKRAKRATMEPEFPIPPEMENDEEKIVRTLKSAGGSLHQSQIAEQCKFSKAKTSQLLKFMEKKGVIKRYKRGRDKIVTLIKVGEVK